MTTYVKPLFIAALLGATGVLLGAFGAHGLKHVLSPTLLTTFTTAVHYQQLHALALLAVGVLQALAHAPLNYRALVWSGRLFAVGVVLFSGSLYALVATGVKLLGLITPIGGVLLVLGWLMLAWAAVAPANHPR